MEIKLNDEQLQGLLGQAIVQAMTLQGKDEIIMSALKYLTEKQRESGNYNARMVSPIQLAFERALDNEAYKIATQVVAEPKFRGEMHALVVQATEQLFSEENRGLVVERIAKGIQKAFEVRYE